MIAGMERIVFIPESMDTGYAFNVDPREALSSYLLPWMDMDKGATSSTQPEKGSIGSRR